MTDESTRQKRSTRFSDSVGWWHRSERRWKLTKILCQTGGGALLGWGSSMGGNLLTWPTEAGAGVSPTWKLFVLMAGVVSVVIGGLMTFYDRNPDDLDDVIAETEAERDRGDKLLAERDSLSRELEDVSSTSTAAVQRMQLKSSLDQVLLQAVETASLDGCKVPASIQMLLDISTNKLLQALGVDQNEDWAISVFQRRPKGSDEAMVRICQRWANKLDSKKDRRFWLKGEGYTGHAWSTRKPVVVYDAQSVDALNTFSVPAKKRILRQDKDGVRADVLRYRSVASFPIRVGPANPRDANWEPWGILTVTTDRVGLFSQEDGVPAGENREIVRYLAALIALIVAGNREFTTRGL